MGTLSPTQGRSFPCLQVYIQKATHKGEVKSSYVPTWQMWSSTPGTTQQTGTRVRQVRGPSTKFQGLYTTLRTSAPLSFCAQGTLFASPSSQPYYMVSLYPSLASPRWELSDISSTLSLRRSSYQHPTGYGVTWYSPKDRSVGAEEDSEL